VNELTEKKVREQILKFDPVVPKKWLFALAGILWSLVGLMLCVRAEIWLRHIHLYVALLFAFFGLILSLFVYRFGFIKIVRKNIDRLCSRPDKSCIFAFQAWRSYLIILIMVTMGLVLRHSMFPKPYLAIIYLTIGGALFFSSIHYYTRFWKMVVLKKSCES